MKKRYLNFLVILLTAATLAATLTGCAATSQEESSIEELSASISWYEDLLESAQTDESKGKETDDEQEFVIVIPAGCGAELFYGAHFLSDEMSKYVGYDVEVVYDSEFEISDENIEVLVGNTERRESIKYIKGLRVHDYGYGYIDDSVVIGAHSEELCVEAIEAFVEHLADGTVDLVAVNNLTQYVVYNEYDVCQVTLCGFPIYEYDIVYPEENLMSERELANVLRDRIAEYCGYSLRVISDDKITDATRAICVGKCALSSLKTVDGNAYIALNSSGNIELVSDKNAGIYYAIERFVDIIKQSEKTEDGNCNIEIDGLKTYRCNDWRFSLCIMRDYFATGSIEDYVTVIDAVRDNSLAIFDGFSDEAKSEMSENLGEPCGIEENGFYYTDGSDTKCVFAKSTLFGGAKLITLIIEKSDGKQVVFVGGFCDGEGDENFLLKLNEECQKYADLPIVVAHELDEALDRSFADANPRLLPVNASCGLYFSSDTLYLASASRTEMSNSLFIDVLELNFYYN